MDPTEGCLKLHYYSAPGRAEASRVLLSLGSKQWEDVGYEWTDPSKWKEFKPKTPFGQMPVLELPDGTLIAQSGAIERYCAKLAGLHPEHPLEAAKADAIAFFMTDIMEPFIQAWYLATPEEQVKARQELVAGKTREQLVLLNGIIERAEGGYVVGGALSWADVAVYVLLCQLVSGSMEGIPKDLLKDYPALKAYRNKVASVPAIQKLYEQCTEGPRAAFRPDPSQD